MQVSGQGGPGLQSCNNSCFLMQEAMGGARVESRPSPAPKQQVILPTGLQGAQLSSAVAGPGPAVGSAVQWGLFVFAVDIVCYPDSSWV